VEVMMRETALAAIVAVLIGGGAWAAAQQIQAPYGTPAVPADIRTGDDIGFRVREMKNGRAIGTLVVRTKSGDWVEALSVPTQGHVVPLESK
jgi:hypothetical protein